MSELPPGWESTRIADVAEVRLGRQRSPKRATGDRMRPYLRAANVTWSGLNLSDVKEMDFTESESETYELRPGDLLLSEASGSPGEVGKPAQYQGEIEGCCFQNTLIRVRLPEGLLPDFYECFFREQALNGRFAAGSRGVGIHHLGASGLADWRVPIPPLAEQRRIVGAIEEAFSKLDAGEAGLRNVRLLLKRMRDAVLTAAVTGRLVPQDPADTPATELLAGLGVEPINPDGVPDLPDGWARARIGDVIGPAGLFVDGDWVESKDQDPEGEVRLTQLADIGDGCWRDRSNRSMTAANSERLGCTILVPGDVLVARMPDPLGRACQFPGDPRPCVTVVDVAIIRPSERGVDPAWLMWAINSGPVRAQIDSMKAGTTRKRISRKNLAAVKLDVPPPAEQARIVAELDRQLSDLRACEQSVEAGLERSAALRRAVLKAAFAGQLVPQDPTDEPASILLERIRAEREAAPKAKTPRRPRKAANP